MKILYIYPHPDDESYGPANVMHKQLREGHKVYLLTLTKGGATKQRFKFNYSIEEMGEVRYKEMLNVASTLGLTEMKVLDLPDSGLKEMDPREIENIIKNEIERIKPDVIASYAVHGISGFHDHIVAHAVVKRVYVELNEKLENLRRLAFVTIKEEEAAENKYFHLSGSKPDEIDCVIKVDKVDVQKNMDALDCYVTYQDTIKNSGIKDHISNEVVFEIFQEDFNPPLKDLFEKLEA